MSRSKSSKLWLQEHFDDQFVKQSQRDGYRSRASYKLIELLEKDRILRPGQSVLDLGSAPGGWSQVAADTVGDSGRVVASDILPMDSLAGVTFVQGDFTEQAVYDRIILALDGKPVDLVLSDMAPNISGMKDIDQPRIMHLADLALDIARSTLAPGGSLLVKVFQGEGIDQYREELKARFTAIKTRKPSASRDRSREIYLLATGFREEK